MQTSKVIKLFERISPFQLLKRHGKTVYVMLRSAGLSITDGKSAEFPLPKHAYSNILKVLPPKIVKFSDKNF